MITVGASPESTALRTTAWCPRCTPSNVPIATARGCRSSCAGECAIFIAPPLLDPRRASSAAAGVSPMRAERLVDAEYLLFVCFLDPERPDLGAPQRHAMASERVCDRSHVGARADAQIEGEKAGAGVDHVERLDA